MYGDVLRKLPWRSGSGLCRGKARGHVFCAVVGDRPYLRFVPSGGGPLVTQEATCLRMIECEPATPRAMPADLLAGVYAAWGRARADIYRAWQHQTDPKNLQPKVPPLNHEVAALLRESPPADVPPERLTKCLDALAAPLSRREEVELRRAFRAEHVSPRARAKAAVEAIERLGLRPAHPPGPLPPIGQDEVHLVCWMGVEPVPK